MMSSSRSISTVRLFTYSCFATTLVAGISGTLLGPAFQSLSERFTIPLDSSGIFTALQFIGITLSVITTGRLLDRIDARYALMTGTALTGTGLLMIAGAPSLWIALLGSFILGLGYGIADVGSNVVVGALNPEHTGAALTLLAFFYGLGAILGPQLVNLALAQHNFTLAFTATGIVGLVLILPFSRGSLHIHQDADPAAGAGTRIRWFIMLPFALLLFTYIGVEIGFGSWIVTQLTLVTRFTESMATVGASLFWVGLTAARGVGSILLKRLTDTQVLTFSIILVIVGTALMLLMPTVQAVGFVSAFIVGFGCGPIFPIAIGLAGNMVPHARGTISGTLMAIGTLGGALLPWVQGKVGGGHSGGMEVVLVLGIITIIVERFLPHHTGQSGTESTIAK